MQKKIVMQIYIFTMEKYWQKLIERILLSSIFTRFSTESIHLKQFCCLLSIFCIYWLKSSQKYLFIRKFLFCPCNASKKMVALYCLQGHDSHRCLYYVLCQNALHIRIISPVQTSVTEDPFFTHIESSCTSITVWDNKALM